MLAIQLTKSADETCCPNVLPCRVHHDGPVNASPRYWDPRVEADGSTTSYFRGRRLRGTAIKIPEGYKGVVLEKTEREVKPTDSTSAAKEHVEGGDEADEEIDDEMDDGTCLAMDQVGSFEEVVVWGHEVPPNPLEDPYCKGIDEWLRFTQAMHSYEEHDGEEKQTRK